MEEFNIIKAVVELEDDLEGSSQKQHHILEIPKEAKASIKQVNKEQEQKRE